MKTLILILLMAFVSLAGWAQGAPQIATDPAGVTFDNAPAANYTSPTAFMQVSGKVSGGMAVEYAVDFGTLGKAQPFKKDGKDMIFFSTAHALNFMAALGYKVTSQSTHLSAGQVVHWFAFERKR